MTDAHIPVDELDPAVIGSILINMAAASEQMGHASVRATIRDYFDADDSDVTAEGRFIKAMFTEPTSVIAERWYGGPWGVAEVVGRAMDA